MANEPWMPCPNSEDGRHKYERHPNDGYECSRCKVYTGYEVVHRVCNDSAAQIATLEAQVDTLTRERDEAVRDVRTLLLSAKHDAFCNVIAGVACNCWKKEMLNKYPDAGHGGEAAESD